MMPLAGAFKQCHFYGTGLELFFHVLKNEISSTLQLLRCVNNTYDLPQPQAL